MQREFLVSWSVIACKAFGAPSGRALPDRHAVRQVGTDRRAVRVYWNSHMVSAETPDSGH